MAASAPTRTLCILVSFWPGIVLLHQALPAAWWRVLIAASCLKCTVSLGWHDLRRLSSITF
jgi:hypothetical protein